MTRYRADENLPYFCTITILDWTLVFVETRYIEPLVRVPTYVGTLSSTTPRRSPGAPRILSRTHHRGNLSRVLHAAPSIFIRNGE